jgi:hypothetical protein
MMMHSILPITLGRKFVNMIYPRLTILILPLDLGSSVAVPVKKLV